MRVSRALTWLQRHALAAGAALVGLFILGANAWFAFTAGDSLIMDNGRLLAGDFMAFWSAGRMTLEGGLAAIYADRPIYEAQLAQVPGLEVVYLWHHPPTFLLVAVALAPLPYLTAAALFLAVTATLYAVAVRLVAQRDAALLFAFMAPAAAMHFGNVQTGLLTAALAGLALLWLQTRPLLSGALIGLFVIKPHLAVLFPVALAAAGRWRAFAAAAVVTLLLCAASLWAFGPETWRAFFENMVAAQGMVTDQKIAAGTYAALFANLRGLGAPVWIAWLAHGASALLATALVFWLWRRNQGGHFAGAALAAASTLISPYLFFYDLTLFLVAAALLVRGAGGWSALSRLEQAVVVYAWAAPGLLFSVGFYVPVPFAALAAWGLLLIAARRGFKRAETAPAPPAQARLPSVAPQTLPPYPH